MLSPKAPGGAPLYGIAISLLFALAPAAEAEDGNWVVGTEDADVLKGGDEEDTIFGHEGDDTLRGLDANDRMDGGAGDDILEGGGGDDWLYGGEGDDLIYGASKERDEPGDDALFGQEGADLLYGGPGADSIDGGEGDDRLIGGSGIDYLVGGPGQDAFVVYSSDGLGDVIIDFETGVDRILIGGAAFGLTETGPLSEDSNFSSGSGLPAEFPEGVPTVHFDTDGGGLWVDPTGGTADDVVLLIGLDNAQLSARDVVIR